MITSLTTAIVNAYNAAGGASLRAVNTGGLHFHEAPQAVSEPYTTFDWVGSATDDQMGGQAQRIERAEIQFSIISRTDSDGGREVAKIAGLLMSWLDWVSLTMTGGFTHIASERNGTGPLISIDDIWQQTLTYTIWYKWS